jgi:hypothetical protein
MKICVGAFVAEYGISPLTNCILSLCGGQASTPRTQQLITNNDELRQLTAHTVKVACLEQLIKSCPHLAKSSDAHSLMICLSSLGIIGTSRPHCISLEVTL